MISYSDIVKYLFAKKIKYDNTTSLLAATDVQGAIDLLATDDTIAIHNAANIGTEGEGVFAQKSGTDLDFFKIVGKDDFSFTHNIPNQTLEAQINVGITNTYFVCGARGNDTTGTGSQAKPFLTIQKCLNTIGQARSDVEYKQHVVVNLGDSNTAIKGTSASWNGQYVENIIVPYRSIAFVGRGISIQGTVDVQVAPARKFTTSSSDFRACIQFQGVFCTRDTHQRLRAGLKVEGAYNERAMVRGITSITGHDLNQIDIEVSGYNAVYTSTLAQPYNFATAPTLKFKIDGGGEVTANFTTETTAAQVVATINTAIGGGATNAEVIGTKVRIKSTLKSRAASVQITGANTILGMVLGTVYGYDGAYQIDAGLVAGEIVRIAVAECTSAAYNGTYDIITKNSDTNFTARKVTGNHSLITTETKGYFFECDSAGSSQATHDVVFSNTYMVGGVTVDDGTASGAAMATGGTVFYGIDSKFYLGLEGRAITMQRVRNCSFETCPITIGTWITFDTCYFGSNLTITTITYAATDMGIMNCKFGSALTCTIPAGKTLTGDSVSLASWSNNVTPSNTVTLAPLDEAKTVKFNPVTSGLAAASVTVQAAVDELAYGSCALITAAAVPTLTTPPVNRVSRCIWKRSGDGALFDVMRFSDDTQQEFSVTATE